MLRKYWINISSWLLFVSVIVSCSQDNSRVPFKGPITIDSNGDTAFYEVPDYNFLDQDSILISKKSNLGKVCAINFFFTACPTQCPIITHNLNSIVHQEFQGNSNVISLSITLDPEYDTQGVLKRYASEYKIDTDYWKFLRADDLYTFKFMNKALYQPGAKDANEPGGIGHSANVVLVDRYGRMRDFYSGESIDELDKLVDDIYKLLKE